MEKIMYYSAGDMVYIDFFDINGKIIRNYKHICFGAFFNSNNWNNQRNIPLIDNTTLITIRLKHRLVTSRIAYFAEQMAQFGMYDNVKLSYDKKWMYLSLNPKLTSAQEMFFVSIVHRLICFLPDVARSFYHIHKKTNFKADLLLLLCHWVRWGKGGFRENICSDHTLLGGYGNESKIKGSFKDVLTMVRSYVKLPQAQKYTLNGQTYHSLFNSGIQDWYKQTVEFIDIKQLENLCG